MCGLIVALEPRSGGPCLEALRRAVSSLDHRGPDHRALLRHGPVGLGHTRLAIVDVWQGNQPLTSVKGELVLVANGEVYNAPEIVREAAARGITARTRSDNEAILLAYQLDPERFVERLHGMFAFVLVDFARRRLVAARDRLGIKPLFVHQSPGRLLLASEIKALIQFPGVDQGPDAPAIRDTLTFGYAMGRRTAFAGIATVPPGHVLETRLDETEPVLRPYWRPETAMLAMPRRTPEEASARLRDALECAVRSHLIGEADHLLYLSGGLDSSILATLLADAADGNHAEHALSLHFDERRFDESDEASDLAAELGLSLEKIPEQTWGLQELSAAIRALEQPQIVTLDLSMQQLSRAARDKGCKFVFAGDGADELFGGYDHFGLAKSRDFSIACLPPAMRHATMAHALRSRGYPSDFDAHYFEVLDAAGWPDQDADDPRMLPWYPIWAANAKIQTRVMPGIGGDGLDRDGAMADLWRRVAPSSDGLAPIQSYICFELLSRLPNWILLKSDRNAMANAIEVRVPFLDCDFVDAALACPPEWLGAPLHEKLSLKHAFSDRLRSELLSRPKRPFNTPHGWVFKRCAAELDDLLSPTWSGRTGLFDAKAVAAVRGQVDRAYAGGLQPKELFAVLGAQTLLGVITTELLFANDWRVRAGTDIEVVDPASLAPIHD